MLLVEFVLGVFLSLLRSVVVALIVSEVLDNPLSSGVVISPRKTRFEIKVKLQTLTTDCLVGVSRES